MEGILSELLGPLPASLRIEITLFVLSVLTLRMLRQGVRETLDDDFPFSAIFRWLINAIFGVGSAIAIIIWMVSILIRYL